MSVQMPPLFNREGAKAPKISDNARDVVDKAPDTTTFAKKLDVLINTEGGLKKVRELAIELATRGMLLPDADKRSWRETKLADVVIGLQNGISKRRGDSGAAIPVLRLADIEGGVRLRNTDLREIVLTDEEQEKYRVNTGDVLVIRVNGSEALVGRFIHCKPDRDIAYSDHLIRIQPRLDLIDPAFLCATSRGAAARTHLASRTVTTAGQKTINQQGLGSLPLVLPPLVEQRRIVAKVDQLMALCDEFEARQARKREVGARLTNSALEALTSAEGPEEFERAWGRVRENFGVLIDSSKKVEDLRRVVLELAVRGLLVPPTRAPNTTAVGSS